MIVKLQGTLDDTADSMAYLIGRLRELHLTETDRKWRLNLRDCTYLGPWAVAVIYGAFLMGKKRRQEPKVVLPQSPPALAAFCRYSGMAREFANGAEPDPEHSECETIPMEHFTSASWDRSNGILRLLRRHTEIDAELEDQIRTCVQEVIQNIEDHAASLIGGVMSARYFMTTREVRVGIVDRGVGIATKFRSTFAGVPDTRTVLERVIAGNHSSKSRPNNMGLGISNLFGIVRNAGGRLVLFTEDAVAEAAGGLEPIIRTEIGPFPGTAVLFSLPVSH